ncbi:MAG: single-stranded DNA-binding protein [Myxococcales bacterium]|nr:single-stranded DNA-binding protein [Myxococcales bacterium]
MSLVRVSRKLSRGVDKLAFAAPITHVYNPLEYAREPHERYLELWGQGTREVLFLGMNPGPFGMAQTGVPFGDIAMVRDFLGVTGVVKAPKGQHPKRQIQGFDCPRSEVSGTRLWGWARERYGTADKFFARNFIINYCPLVFMEESGKNFTPDKLPVEERDALFAVCDQALRETVKLLQPKWLVGVGAFAKKRAEVALADSIEAGKLQVGTILHPSPASPRANRGWSQAADEDLKKLGLQ